MPNISPCRSGLRKVSSSLKFSLVFVLVSCLFIIRVVRGMVDWGKDGPFMITFVYVRGAILHVRSFKYLLDAVHYKFNNCRIIDMIRFKMLISQICFPGSLDVGPASEPTRTVQRRQSHLMMKLTHMK